MAEFLAKLWQWLLDFFKPSAPVVTPETKPLPSDERYKLRLYDSKLVDRSGLKVLRLVLGHQGVVKDSWNVVSGQPGAQVFRQGWESKAGSMEPLPEGYYTVGPVEFKGAKGDYKTSWGPGLGPVWLDILPKMKTSRSALGFHLDENMSTAPGTAGCVAFQDTESLKRFVMWFNKPNLAPKELTVNWGLGSVETKAKEPSGSQWKGPDQFIQSPNYNSAREGTLNKIVLHNTEGTVTSAIDRFLNTSEQVSAHYILGRNGKTVQMVKDSHVAWHAGDRGVNHTSIGIEIEAGGGTGTGMTEMQETNLVLLIKSLMFQYGITLNNIIPHRHTVATSCPGSIWPTDASLEAWKAKHLG